MLEALVLFLAAFVQGLAGFAFALLAVPLLSLEWPLLRVVPLVALCGFTLNVLMLWLLRRSFHWRPVAGLVLAAIPGVFVGAKALGFFPEKVLRWVLFVAVSGYALWETLNPGARRIRLSPRWGPLFGFAAGFLGGMLNTPGPPVVVYVSLLRMDKDTLKSALQGAFLCIAAFMVAAHGLYGRLSPEILRLYATYLPFIVGGMFLGQWIYLRLGERSYHRLVHLFLVLSALASLLKVF
ncbi:sulfite exporter TauE/SafE family protein [Thermosulfurimonas sp. F29]|uniref:sulfite exporter TauE/SafE family protein n=1 Tax=Thermosulfurimonas sp. F29 TaxID=2867247 RepID=UPI001C83C456|nr:sulfite exporter TauE/SafE family protein [Thermosulfurimonas sp. F29]MBX6422719.1 sulfite exporter TauE/SafE family protein [Thermosulfurimonas sp. F29]